MGRGWRRRPPRKGKGLLPGNPKQWANEHNGLDLREDLGVGLSERLPVSRSFEQLLRGVTIKPHGSIPCAQIVVDKFRGDLRSFWSAFALPISSNNVVVVYNDSHSIARRRATLMEEFFHLRLGHPPSLLRVYKEGSKRTFSSEIERQAYGSGAAALVPFKPLREMIRAGIKSRELADHFCVSPQLIIFRSKVTRLYKQLMKPQS